MSFLLWSLSKWSSICRRKIISFRIVLDARRFRTLEQWCNIRRRNIIIYNCSTCDRITGVRNQIRLQLQSLTYSGGWWVVIYYQCWWATYHKSDVKKNPWWSSLLVGELVNHKPGCRSNGHPEPFCDAYWWIYSLSWAHNEGSSRCPHNYSNNWR